MIYTHENVSIPCLVYDEHGKEIKQVASVDLVRAELHVSDDPPRLNEAGTGVARRCISFERIEISRTDAQTGMPKEFCCYGLQEARKGEDVG